ncbi:MFS transporter [Granulicoccus phenolivorans]|uniref:MFS transporter n=1 Tax=Granulicoccus phenolivorans TaxID=266854 RepID=UPI0004165BA6|nr:MFS transporter [Granulicoccus phenolivorans]
MPRLLADTRPLRNPDFKRLWTANIITVIGAQVTVAAVPAQLYQITQSSGMVGLTGLFGLVPLVVFGLWGGAMADAFNRRTLMLISTLGLIGTAALFTVQAALGLNNPWLILGLFAIQQAFFAINQPTRTAVLPQLLPKHLLPAANSLNMTVMQFGAIAGPLLGGALIPVLGYTVLYLIDTLCLVATLWAVLHLPSLPPPGGLSKPNVASVLDGLAYLRTQPILMMSFVVDLIAMVFGMPRALFPQIAHESFGGPLEGGWQYAVLMVAIPAGAALGGVFSGWVSQVRRHGRAVILCIIVWGLGIVGFGITLWLAVGEPWPWLGVATLLLAIAGAADMASAAFRQTMLQSAADESVRGRLQGVFIVVVAGGPRLADTLHGAAAAVVGTAITTTGGGVLVIVGVILAALIVPAFWRYRA